MATSLAQVFSEARSLVTRLHDREKTADAMVGQAHTLNEKISCMKEYKEDLHELNDMSHQKPRTALVHSLQQENRQIRLLQEENRQLKLALEDHQAALELIMQRYRQQMLRIMQLTKVQGLVEKVASGSDSSSYECAEGVRHFHEFGRVFDSCLKLGEDASHHDQMEMARLRTENLGLRKIIDAAGKNEVLAKQANLLHAFVKAAAEEYFSAAMSANSKKAKRDEFLHENDENRTPTADRSPEAEASTSLPVTDQINKPSEQPSSSENANFNDPITTSQTSSNSKGDCTKAEPVNTAKTYSSTNAGSKPSIIPAPSKKSEPAKKPPGTKAKSPIKTVPSSGGSTPSGGSKKSVALSAAAGKSTPVKTVVRSNSGDTKPNGNNNVTSAGNANRPPGASPAKKSTAGAKSATVTSGANMKRSASSGTGNPPVSSFAS